jgi:16S rRNA (cytosine967-C5)-methyltransferase
MRASAREVAAQVLTRVQKDQAFAAAVLESEFSRGVQLEPRDRALATELVYGTLRFLPWIDGELASCATRGVVSGDAHVRLRLAIAAYQIVFTRVPAFAAVSEAVQAVRDIRGPRMAAFANAVLRNLARRAEERGTIDRMEALRTATPHWLRDALGRALTPEGADAFLGSGVDAPPVSLRVEAGEQRDAWVARLQAEAPEGAFEAGTVSPLAILAREAGKVQRLPGWGEGAWSVQEEGSQWAALAVGAQTGERVLDACAGRGNKSAVLARAVGARGALHACDNVPSKLERLHEDFVRLNLSASTFAVDWRVGAPGVAGPYDRILVDAPCSGIGTLRRRPEIALRREHAHLAEMAALQLDLLLRVAGHLRRGGTLVYVVCSVLREEGEDVLDRFLALNGEFRPASFEAPVARVLAGSAPFFRLLPNVHGTDGYFVARLTRA